MPTTEPTAAEVRDALLSVLRPPSPRRGRGIVEVLLPQALAERAHAITVEPMTPIYHAVCTARRTWPSQEALRIRP